MKTSQPFPTARQRPLGKLALAVAMSFASSLAGAATLAVTTAADADVDDADCSLREAIVAANSDAAYHGCPAGSGADLIVFSLPLPATIALASDLPTIVSTLAIHGPGADQLAIDGQDLHQILVLDSPGGGEWLGVTELSLTRGLAAIYGGGAYVESGETAYFRRVRFDLNRATSGGGGLAVDADDGEPTVVGVDECWFSGNVALGSPGGGGILATDAGTQLYVDRTTLSANRADHSNGSAGGAHINRAWARFTRSTISGNFANHSGGGLRLSASTNTATLELIDSTVYGNQAEANGDTIGDGGGLHTSVSAGQTATLLLANSILAGNLDSGLLSHPDVSVFSGIALVSQGFNLIGSNEGGSTFFVAGLPNGDGDWIGTVTTPIDPLLDALADQGGFAPTHQPTANPATPLIDKGFCTGSGGDQRGYGDAAAHVRIVDTAAPNGAGSDGCDIGAFERAGNPEAEPDLFADDFESGHLLYWGASTT